MKHNRRSELLKNLFDDDIYIRMCHTILLDEVRDTTTSTTTTTTTTTTLELLSNIILKQCLMKTGGDKVKLFIDSTSIFEDSNLDIEDKRSQLEHEIKNYYMCNVNKKTERVITELFIDNKTPRCKNIVKNKYDYVLLFNGLDVLVVNKRVTLEDLETKFANYFKNYRNNDFLDIEDIIEVVKEECIKHSVEFVDATTLVTRDENLLAIYKRFDQINIARFTEENSNIFIQVADLLKKGVPDNLYGCIMLFNGIRKTILGSNNRKKDIVLIVKKFLSLRGVVPDARKPDLLLRSKR